jgi:hypothetical protein
MASVPLFVAFAGLAAWNWVALGAAVLAGTAVAVDAWRTESATAEESDRES